MNDSSATQPLDKISIGGYAEFDVRHSTLIAEYVDSTDAYRARDFKTLVQRLANDGYIYIRGVLPIHKVLAARAAVARTVQEVWQCLTHEALKTCTTSPTSPLLVNGRYDENQMYTLTGFSDVIRHPDVQALVAGEELSEFFIQLFHHSRSKEERDMQRSLVPASLSNNWIRVKGPGQVTDVHTDFYQFASLVRLAHEIREHPRKIHDARIRSYPLFVTPCDLVSSVEASLPKDPEQEGIQAQEYISSPLASMYTCWTPLSTLPASEGTLAILEKSHRLIDLSPESKQLTLLSSLKKACNLFEDDDEKSAPDCKRDDEKLDTAESEQIPTIPGVDLGETPALLVANLPFPSEDEQLRRRVERINALLSSMPPASEEGKENTQWKWRYGSLNAGDVIVFDTRCTHASTRNDSSDRIRLSIDTRWMAVPSI